MCGCGGELTDCPGCGGDLCDYCGCGTCRDDEDDSDRGCPDCGSFTCGGYPNCPPDDEDQDPEPVDNPEQPQ